MIRTKSNGTKDSAAYFGFEATFCHTANKLRNNMEATAKRGFRGRPEQRSIILK